MKTAHCSLALALFGCRPSTTTVEPTPHPPKTSTPPGPVADEPSYLASIFRRTPLRELEVVAQSVDETIGEVKHELRFFTVTGLSAALTKDVDAAVRRLGRIDDWKDKAKGRGGAVFVTCSAGLAYVELVSFGCDVMDSTLTLEEIAEATGGAPGAATGYGETYSLVEGRLTPVALADLLLPTADLAALARRAATEGESNIDNWKDDSCPVGPDSSWMLELDGLRIWDEAQRCQSLVIPYEVLAPAIEPGGVIARYLAITDAS